ncbi:MAG: hypothetical protein KDA21_01975 [Phycisphaerales bacterium]|nr:hypothetical protein [Phycisphaerales bacterium]
MRAQPIIDLSDIDLSARVADRDAIGEVNPHRGLMALLDAIVWHSDDYNEGIAIKHTTEDEFWVPGHIPGYALMPGVLMLEAAAQLSSFLYYRRSRMTWFAGFTRIEDTVFRGQVRPGDDLFLLARGLKYNPKRFITHVQGLVNDDVVFEARITGMAFPNVNAEMAADSTSQPA